MTRYLSMKQRIAKAMLIAALAVILPPAHAEDIDLFAVPTPAGDLPNVLFVIDNTANWSTAFTNEMSALAAVFRDLPEDKFNIGIMLAAETGTGNSSIGGGYVRAAIRRMDASNKLTYKTLIENLEKDLDKGNGGRTNLTMAEVYYYFTGGTPFAGNGKIKTDYLENVCSGTSCNLVCDRRSCSAAERARAPATNAVFALPGNALDSFSDTTYNSPIFDGSCAKNFIIYLSNGANQGNNDDNKEANDRLRAAGGDTTEIPLTPNGSQSDPSDEWARFLATSRVAAKTYTIDVNAETTGQGPGWSAMLNSMADVSGGKYFSVKSETGAGKEIADAVLAALSEIQSVNSVFASVSLPVSVNTQGSFLNQVYVGLFRPEQAPRWNGNLKQYKLNLESGGQLRLVDADGTRAINTTTGFITECARSFWTPSVIDTYWRFKPLGSCIPPGTLAADAYAISNFPDGNVVEKGGQGFMLRRTSVAARVLKTCPAAIGSCQADALTDFNSSNGGISQALLGAATSTERDALVDWMRGNDNQDENSNTDLVEMRPSVHGDVVHSRPVALNFGTDASPKVGVFYGANDGVLRAINGNRTADIDGAPAGDELWAFVPPEFYGSIKRLRDNTKRIDFFDDISDDATSPKSYGPDGSVSAFFDGSMRWLYSTMRRGGRVVYAFDVNPSNPGDVKLKWKKGCPNQANDSDCITGYSDIGQTWSAPVPLRAKGEPGRPLLILSGGYDTCEDADPHTCTGSTKGNRIYVLDANTGALLKTLNTDRAVIGDVALVPDASTGLAIYAYVADLGGNVYRITIGSDEAPAWTITKIASLGCNSVTTCAPNRKFMFTTDIIRDGDELILLLGSGDREKPLLGYTAATSVSNYFFMLRDKPTDSSWLTSEFGNCSANLLCLNSLFRIDRSSTAAPTAADLGLKKGWFLEMVPTEQVVTSSITIFGTVSFSTQQPQAPTACESGLGITRLYNINYRNGAPPEGETSRFAVLPPVGLPPSPVAGIVILDDGQKVAFCIGCDKDSPLEAKQPKLPFTSTPDEPQARVFWYIEQ